MSIFKQRESKQRSSKHSRIYISWFMCAFYVFVGLGAQVSVAEDHHKDSPSYKSTKITKNISLLQGKGGNIAVLKGSDGLLMIDSDYVDMSGALKKALKPLGGEKELTYIVNTHWHGDHTGGSLKLNSPATIVAHDNVRTRLLTRQEVKLFDMVSEPYPEKALPSLTYSEKINLHFNNEEISIVHYAKGHTDGDSVVFFKKANVVHMGDHFFSGMFPFVDVGTGGNVVTLAKNVESVLAQIDDKTQVIPGHGPLSSKADLAAFHKMLLGTTKEVKTMKNRGMSLASIQKKGLSDKWDDWTKGFLNTETWISIVYSSL